MADSENLPDDSEGDNTRSMLVVQQGEQNVRLAEINAQSEHSQNQKEVALQSIEVGANDRAQDRKMYARESTKGKFFIAFLVTIGSAVICFLVVNGEAELIKTLIIEGSKVLLGFVGGAGFAYYNFGRQRNNVEN